MKVFVTGEQTRSFVEETLTDLHEEFCITEISASCLSPCVKHVANWCEKYYVPITVFMPEETGRAGAMLCNRLAMVQSEPNFVLVYEEGEAMKTMITNLAAEVESVEFLAQKE